MGSWFALTSDCTPLYRPVDLVPLSWLRASKTELPPKQLFGDRDTFVTPV
jgi:hypothetical protein